MGRAEVGATQNPLLLCDSWLCLSEPLPPRLVRQGPAVETLASAPLPAVRSQKVVDSSGFWLPTC